MANVKFSQFNDINPLPVTGYVVGYDSATNLNTKVSLQNLAVSLSQYIISYVEHTSAGGESSFVVPALSGKAVKLASRSGLVKGITTGSTSDTSYLQVVNDTITLPTGDITMAGELFIFIYSQL